MRILQEDYILAVSAEELEHTLCTRDHSKVTSWLADDHISSGRSAWGQRPGMRGRPLLRASTRKAGGVCVHQHHEANMWFPPRQTLKLYSWPFDAYF